MLARLANIGRNFKNQSGNVQGYNFDTIIIPGNVPDLEDLIKRIIRSDGYIGNDWNDVNTQKGIWKLIVNHRWVVPSGSKPYILMSSEAQRDKEASVFYDRIPLDVANEVNIKNRNLEWSGYTRMSAGFFSWDHVIMGGAAVGTTLT